MATPEPRTFHLVILDHDGPAEAETHAGDAYVAADAQPPVDGSAADGGHAGMAAQDPSTPEDQAEHVGVVALRCAGAGARLSLGATSDPLMFAISCLLIGATTYATRPRLRLSALSALPATVRHAGILAVDPVVAYHTEQ